MIIASARKMIKYANTVLEPCHLINYLRVGVAEFECLLKLVTPYIQKEDTVLRQSVSAKQRLVVTLRFLTCIFQIKDINIKAMSKLNSFFLSA